MTATRWNFVITSTTPTYGMEAAVLALVRALGDNATVTEVGSTKSAPGLRRVRRTLRASHVGEVVVLCGLWTALPGLVLAPRRSDSRGQVAVWEHSIKPWSAGIPGRLKVLTVLAALVYRRAAFVVCVSEFQARTVRRLLGPRVPVICIPNAVTPVSPRATEKAGLHLGVVGSLRPIKRIELAVEALRLLPECAVLDVYGVGPEESRLADLATQLGLGARVHFHGFRSKEDVYGSIDILVVSSRAETFSMTAFEAATCGVPVVAPDRSVFADVIPEYVVGELHDQTPRGIADAVDRVASRDHAEAFGLACRRRERDYSTDAVARAWAAQADRGRMTAGR